MSLGWKRVAIATGAAVLLAAGSARAEGPPDRATAVADWDAQKADEQIRSGWTGSESGCVVGSESQESIDATLRSLNRFRRYAGVGPVRFDPDLNRKALAAALMSQAAGVGDHDPAPSAPCYSAAGRDGAANSNISADYKPDGITGGDAMTSLIEDPFHAKLGLDAGRTVMGTGTASSFSALYVGFPKTTAKLPPRRANAFPGPGWIPWPWAISRTWYVAIGSDPSTVDISKAKVTMTIDGKPLPAERHAGDGLETAYAGRYLSWNPGLRDSAGRENGVTEADHVIHVDIKGVTVAGQPLPIAYTVCALQRPIGLSDRYVPPGPVDRCGETPTVGLGDNGTVAVPGPVTPGPGAAPGNPALAAVVPRFVRAPGLRRLLRTGAKGPIGPRVKVGTRLAVAAPLSHGRLVAYRWRRNGSVIVGETRPTYLVRSYDKGFRINVQVTAAPTSGAPVARRSTASVRVRG
ncbi:hypothetical protein DSM112329_00531 [Paraconexibacter sp. AEG42_29]|uniref:SCP domain-containing protein n=1 Tax=Paraconexibacter sp. AEG42_29 TaxID=2997339 RepID=A0AAU7APY6_9ACTN